MGVYTTAVQKLYVAYFNRPADAAGLTYWEGVVTAAKGNTAAVAAAFAGSAEYKATYAGMDEYHVVAQVYQNLFGRAPEPAGLTYWGQALINKQFTVDSVVTQIAGGAQGADLIAYNSKVSAATAFTAALDTSDEMLAYSGDVANGMAKTFIAGVTDDASLKAAIADAALNATVQGIVESSPQNVGTIANLTVGMDALIGTARNDVFNALAFNPATGASQTNLSSIDTIDGGAGKDTLNISIAPDTAPLASHDVNVTAGGVIAVGSVKNVEIINIDETAATSAVAVDASAFVGATQINQIGMAGAVTKLAANTTAGFQGIATGAFSVTAAGAAAAVSFKNVGEAATLAVKGATLAGVTVSGTRVDSDASGSVAKLGLNVTAGKDVAAVTVNTAVGTTLTLTPNATNTAGVSVTTIDASASTGSIAFSGDTAASLIQTGAGNDTVTVTTTTNVAAGTTAAINASVATGAGNDTVNVQTTSTGATSVDTGAGNDTVNVTARSSGKLTVSLGDGSDTFTSTVAVNAGDVIDAGAGVDTLALSLVGSANIGAFSNFDLFDTVGLAKTLDVDILASKNTVSEIVASGDVGAAAVLTNVGTAGFRATGDMGATDFLTLTQKTAGAITLTQNAVETGTGTATIDTTTANVIASNATAIKAVFNSSFLASVATEPTAGDNVATFNIKGGAATTLDVTAGGALAHDVLNYTDTVTGGKLTAITVTGDRDLTLAVTNGLKLATIDASAQTGGLTVSTASLADGGTIKLGSGVDKVTVGTASVAAGVESLVGFEKTAAVAVSIVAADATAATAAQADADVLSFGATGITVAADATLTGGAVSKGVLTFTGAGPSDLNAAIAIAHTAGATGTAVAFEYLGNTYVLDVSAGVATDQIVKLVGVTGVTNLGEVGATDTFFLV